MDPFGIFGLIQAGARLVGGAIAAGGQAFCAPDDARCRSVTGTIGGVLGYQAPEGQAPPQQRQPAPQVPSGQGQGAPQGQQLAPDMQAIINAAVSAALAQQRQQLLGGQSPPAGQQAAASGNGTGILAK